ncbi:MAG: hypothetical protein ACOVLB_00535 [Candidatus Nanopelagicus sp.]|jgi:hypothetical protein
MATSQARNTLHSAQTEADIAVLQVQVKNIDDKVSDLKEDLKAVTVSMDKNAQTTNNLIKDMRDNSTNAHKSMSDKINSLEKWRWMMMGAGIVIGSIGFETVAKLLK